MRIHETDVVLLNDNNQPRVSDSLTIETIESDAYYMSVRDDLTKETVCMRLTEDQVKDMIKNLSTWIEIKNNGYRY